MTSINVLDLPILYKSLVPLCTLFHPRHGIALSDGVAFAAATHAIPLTVDEFSIAQRDLAIVFGIGDSAAPLALCGLTAGANLYIDSAGKWQEGIYLPAFIRRYPFMLAKLGTEATELSLCFDDTSDIVTPRADNKLFSGDNQTETTRAILRFCVEFEGAVLRTRHFIQELERLDLLIDGEIRIERSKAEPVFFRGFRIVAEDRLQGIPASQARKMTESGMMGLIYAHLLSLCQISTLSERQFEAHPNYLSV